MSEQICPKCGSDDIDHPRHYRPQGSSMAFDGCSAHCRACKHEERFETHQQALEAWRDLAHAVEEKPDAHQS